MNLAVVACFGARMVPSLNLDPHTMFRLRSHRRSMATALGRLNPTAMIDNPVVFALELLAVAATLLAIIRLASASAADASFAAVAGAGLWALVFLAVFGKAFGGGRRAARLDAWRATRQQTVAKRLSASGVGDRRRYELVASDLLVPGDLVLVEANETIPTDGVVVAGVASVDEVSDNRRVCPGHSGQ